jgi:1,4-alpha-glucan branching enzyme
MDPKCASAECASLSGHRTPSASRSASAAAIIRRRARHFGPEGIYLSLFAPYLTDRHKSPGGAGVNYDSDGSDAVRAYATQAALSWVRDFRADALRLDAVHTIADDSPRHIVGAICAAVAAYAKESGRRIHVVAESDLEDRKVVDPPPKGWGCSAMWADDFHHALHTLLTGEKGAFYVDFGEMRQLARALAEGFVFQGEVASFRKKAWGTDTKELAPARFVFCAQNHDPVGNRPTGERLSALVPFEALFAVATVVVLGSGLPLLFMGRSMARARHSSTSRATVTRPSRKASPRGGRPSSSPRRPTCPFRRTRRRSAARCSGIAGTGGTVSSARTTATSSGCAAATR